MNAPLPHAATAAEPLPVAAVAPWARWQRDLRRLAGQIGFKPVGVVLIIALGATLWFDSANDKLAHQRRERNETATELQRMQALAAMKTHIEDGLRESIPQYEQLRQKGLAGPSIDQAVENWRNEWNGLLAAQRIIGGQIMPVPPGKQSPPNVAAIDLAFDAVPSQLVALVQQIEQGDRLQHIASLDTTVADDRDNPHLQVKMRLEARYFPPEGKAPAASALRRPPPAHPAASNPPAAFPGRPKP